MFDFHAASPRDRAWLCGGGPTRRDFLQVGALSAVGLSLPQYARAAALGLGPLWLVYGNYFEGPDYVLRARGHYPNPSLTPDGPGLIDECGSGADQGGSEAACRAAGKLRTEGKDYVVKDGDVMHFLFNV